MLRNTSMPMLRPIVLSAAILFLAANLFAEDRPGYTDNAFPARLKVASP